MQLIDHPSGGYRFLTGIAPYSSAVIAQPGHAIVRVQLAQPLPLGAGFEQIATYLAAQSRPRQALCAMELRIPEPLSFDGFAMLNMGYRGVLAQWDILVDAHNPIARTNVAPAAAAPTVPSLYAFCYTIPTAEAITSFVVAGAGDLRDQAELRAEAIIRPGDISRDGLIAKAGAVMGVMTDRLQGIGMDWAQVYDVDIYSIHPPDLYFEAVVLPRLGSAALHGVHWYYSLPPIAGLEYEMDLHRVAQTIYLA